jgi:Reverse transcriptase (RNA-dependent DNA polymerase)
LQLDFNSLSAPEMESKKQLLKGKANFLPWLQRLEGLLMMDERVERNDLEELVVKGATELERIQNNKVAKRYIYENCDDAVMHVINPQDDFNNILRKLNSSYGFGNVDPSIIKKELRSIKFNPSKDPGIMLDFIDQKTIELTSAGGSITDAELVQYIHDGLSGDHERDTFWFACRGEMSMRGLHTFTVDSAAKYIQKFWNAYKISTPAFSGFTGIKSKKTFKARHCDFCETKFPQIAKTHDTEFCRKVKELDKSDKVTSNYSFEIFHDSGTSKSMVKDDILENEKESNAKVYTAGKYQAPQNAAAEGTLLIGSIPVNALRVPTFSKNLLSATQLSREHGLTQIIEPWTAKLKVLKDDTLVATGSYDTATKLIKIDEYKNENCNSTSSNDWTTIHSRFGHLSAATIQKTLPATSGIPVSKNMFSELEKIPLCEPCMLGKSRHSNISKNSTNNEKDIAEVIEADIQGPFSIYASDGTNCNLKLIDVKSGFAAYFPLTDTTSNTVVDKFILFKTKLERQTGKQVKRLRVDQGTHFMGKVLSYLESSGIIKEKGIEYNHHFPGKCERLHQSILRNGRANLISSNLPQKYYSDAFRYSTYIHNRTIHGSNTKTPFEHIFNRKPDVSNLQPFGAICFAFVPPEKRQKLDPSAIKCRLLGFGDDFETEEIKGYKLLKEDDESIIWSNSVQFDTTQSQIPKLPNHNYEETEEFELDEDIWIPPNEEDEDEDWSDSGYQSAITEVSQSDLQNAIQELNQNHWWKTKENSNLTELCNAIESITTGTPTSFKEAMCGPEAGKWKEAMDKEIASIRENNTYQLVEMPLGTKAIGCKWVFRKKFNKDGTIDKFKARLVAKGFQQKEERDFKETFAPVAKYKSLRLLFSLAANLGLELYHDDVTSAFLNGTLKEKVFLDQPKGYEELSSSHKWLLHKALYGLKQAPREWNEAYHQFMLDEGFTQCHGDPCIYFRKKEGIIYVGLYVDDTISAGTNKLELDQFRSRLKQKFKCGEGGLLNWCLGMEVSQSQNEIKINQTQYIAGKLQEFSDFLDPKIRRSSPLDSNFQKLLQDAESSTETDPSFPYRSAVGSLNYAATGTRPDIASAVGIVSRFLDKPKLIHVEMVKRIFYYLRSTLDYNLNFTKGSMQASGYSDSSWANNADYSSISGYIMLLGNNLISWRSSKQPVVALSSTEAEYVALTSGVQEALWLKQILEELGFNQNTIEIYEDNEGCINIAKNPQEFKRTRHIQVKYHFVREHVKTKAIEIKYVHTKLQLADMLTKGLNGNKLQANCKSLGLSSKGRN